MGVLTLTDEQIWGSSKALLEEILLGVQDIATNKSQIAKLEIAIKGNYAHYSLIGADPEELSQFRSVTRRLIDECERRDDRDKPYIAGTIKLLKELLSKLSSLSG